MADDDLGILAGKNFCPQCGTQLQVPGDEEDEHHCNACGWSGDPFDPMVDTLGTDDDDPDDTDDDDSPGPVPYEPDTGPSYADYVRNARGKSVDDLFAEAAGRVKPPKPIKTKTDLEEALGTAADAALAQGGSCPFCGADPDKITGGVCGECGATQPQGVQAWVIGDGEGKTHGACSELCAKVGAAQVDGKVLGKRPWTPPEDTEPECMACGQPLTAVSPSAAPVGTTPTPPTTGPRGNPGMPGGQPFVAPGAGPGGTTVIGNAVGRTPGDPAPYAVGDRVRMIARPQNVGTVASIDTDHLDLLGKELGRSTAVDMDDGTRGVAPIEQWELIPDDDAPDVGTEVLR